MDSQKVSKSGWVGRILLVLMLGIATYYLLEFTSSCMISALESNVRQQRGSRGDLAIRRGYDWASERDVRDHAVCREQWLDINHDSLERYGCSEYVTEQNVLKVVKPIPQHKGWDDGTTTAECIAEVHAYWDPIVNDLVEKGESDVASSRLSRVVNPLVRQCENFDRF